MQDEVRPWTKYVSVAMALLLLSAMLGTAVPAVAQTDVDVRVTPRVGFIGVGEELYRTSVTNAGTVFRSSSQLSQGRSLGLAVDIGSAERGFFVRLSADRSLGMHSDVLLTEGNDFSTGFSTIEEIATSVTELGLDLILPLRLDFGSIRPYVSAGVGVTRYGFSIPDVSFDFQREWSLPESGSASSTRLGGGFELDVVGRVVTVTILDSISRYFDVTQHHVMASMGVTLGR